MKNLIVEELTDMVRRAELHAYVEGQEPYHPNHCKPGCCKGAPRPVVVGNSRGYIPIALRRIPDDDGQ